MTTMLTLFTMGLLGAGHCFGMCGGIATAISFGSPEKAKLAYVLFYNMGRILSYSIFGALAGGMIAMVSHYSGALLWLRCLTGVMMILLGLYLGQFYNGLVFLERIGQKIWRYISPLASKLLPLKSPVAALPFGFLWGWLPCGMVYSALSLAALSSNSLEGFMLMLAFGMGTLPAMVLVGSAAQSLKKVVNNLVVRRVSATLLILYGLYSIMMFFMHAKAH